MEETQPGIGWEEEGTTVIIGGIPISAGLDSLPKQEFSTCRKCGKPQDPFEDDCCICPPSWRYALAWWFMNTRLYCWLHGWPCENCGNHLGFGVGPGHFCSACLAQEKYDDDMPNP